MKSKQDYILAPSQPKNVCRTEGNMKKTLSRKSFSLSTLLFQRNVSSPGVVVVMAAVVVGGIVVGSQAKARVEKRVASRISP